MLLHAAAGTTVQPRASGAGSESRVPSPEPRVPRPRIPNPESRPKISVAGMNFYYGTHQVLHGVTLKVQANQVTALIGPSGCGKSTFLRSLNRMNDIIPGARVEGMIHIDDRDIYAS